VNLDALHMGLEPRDRDYEAEARDAVLQAEPAAEHPLQAPAAAPADEPQAPAAEPAPAAAPADALDPLTAALQSAELDPLGAAGGGPLAVDHNPIGVTDKALKQREQRRGACPGQPLGAGLRALTPRRAPAQTIKRPRGRCLRTQRLRRSGTPRSSTS
jgi:hypothetical protein